MINVNIEKVKERYRTCEDYRSWSNERIDEQAKVFVYTVDKRLEQNVIEILNDEELTDVCVDDISLREALEIWTGHKNIEGMYHSYYTMDVILEFSYYMLYHDPEVGFWLKGLPAPPVRNEEEKVEFTHIDVDIEKLKKKMKICYRKVYGDKVENEDWLSMSADDFIRNTDKILEPNVNEILNGEELSDIYIGGLRLYDVLRERSGYTKKKDMYDYELLFMIISLLSAYYRGSSRSYQLLTRRRAMISMSPRRCQKGNMPHKGKIKQTYRKMRCFTKSLINCVALSCAPKRIKKYFQKKDPML